MCLIAPRFVAPYRMFGKRGKNAAADAAAICEAVARPAGVRRAAYRTHQPHTRPAVRTGYRPAAEGRDHPARTGHAAGRPARRLMQLSGIGPTTASALVVSIGDAHDFACGRHFAAWLGMVPGRYSSGGKQCLGWITKAGDR